LRHGETPALRLSLVGQASRLSLCPKLTVYCYNCNCLFAEKLIGTVIPEALVPASTAASPFCKAFHPHPPFPPDRINSVSTRAEEGGKIKNWVGGGGDVQKWDDTPVCAQHPHFAGGGSCRQVVGSLGQFRMRRFPSGSVAQVRVAGTCKTVLCDRILWH
jgi:hypothetical protein